MNKNNNMNYILFFITILTTVWCGTKFFGGDLLGGILFSLTIMAILLIHEMGHYLNARSHKLRVTLPYFIPLPVGLGTLGAVISIKGQTPNRNALMDTGAAGPLCGFAASIMAVALGMFIAPVSTVPVSPQLGASLFYTLIAYMVKGVSPAYIAVNPILFAGWLGFYITMLNLIPIGQLDGGHIIYALFGKNDRYEAGMKLFFKIFLVWGIFCSFFFQTFVWLFFGGLIYLLHQGNVIHRPLANEMLDLTLWNKIKGWICIIIFVLTFTI